MGSATIYSFTKTAPKAVFVFYELKNKLEYQKKRPYKDETL